MKVQFRQGGLRLRVDEAELATLFDNGTLALAVGLAGRPAFELQLALGNGLACSTNGVWRVVLPRSAVDAYSRTLPCREGLRFELDAGLALELEVDVRDSVRRRGARGRAG